RMRGEILNGSIEKTLLKLAYPLVFFNLLFIIYNLTDTFWLGKLGREAVSAPTVSFPFIWTMMSFGAGFAIAGFAFVSQYAGAGQWDKAKHNIANLLTLMFFSSFTLGIIGFFITPWILHILGVPADAYDNAVVYLRVMFIGIPFSFEGFAFSFALRAIGDTKTPTIINSIAIILNVILDPLLIFGIGPFPRLEILGAALGTIISYSIASILSIYLVFSGKLGIKFYLSDFKPDFGLYKKMFKIGLPASIGQSLNALGFVVLMGIVSQFGSVVIAAYGIGQRIISLIFTVSDGFSMAMSTMVGQNLGVLNFKRIRKIVNKTILINTIFISIPTLLIFLFRTQIIGIFIKDILVINEGAIFYACFLIAMPFFGIFFISTSVVRTAGRTKESMVLGIIRLWGLRVSLAYFLSTLWGSTGIWIGMAMSNIIASILAYFWYKRETWKETVTKEEVMPPFQL
ncbi:MATE family efflux transporter, partial [candidate division WOR-3 bacterium]|nr:MATE family efflux transporter [candidate division WOR-3 bacterium]